MRIAVTGASGLLGRALLPLLASRENDVFAAVHSIPVATIPTDHQIPFDLGSDQSIRHFVETCEAEVIIHAAAFTDVDGCDRDPQTAYRFHMDATGTLATSARQAGSHVVYISTDYVFDGDDGPYDESAAPNPINEYGRTKLLGEDAVRRTDPESLIIRAGGFLGYGQHGQSTFAERIAETILNAPPVLAAVDLKSNLTPVGFLAAAIVELVESGVRGVRHVAPPFIVSRYEFAKQLALALERPPGTVKGVPYAELDRTAARPLNGGLITQYPLRTSAPDLDEAISTFKSGYLSADKT